MFIPLHDRNALKHIRLQYVTLGLIILNVVGYFLTALSLPEETATAAIFSLGFIPAVVFDYAALDPSLTLVPPDATVLTYSFLHADLMHLGTNMLFLWVFGDNVEDALGHVRFLIFYLLCAAAGAYFHGVIGPQSQVPLIGASGAVSGVIAAYLLLHPKVRVWVLVLFRFPLPLPAAIPLVFWVGQQFVMLATDFGSNVSWGAHVGGILAGGVLVLVMRRRGVPLFDRTIVTPRSVEHEETAPPTPGVNRAEPSRQAVRWGRTG